MKITWDARAKAVYISGLVRQGWEICDYSNRINSDLYLDYNREGEVVGIEILNADSPMVEEIGNHRQRHGKK